MLKLLYGKLIKLPSLMCKNIDEGVKVEIYSML